MKFSYLHFFVFVTSAASQATLRHEISSKGPDVTISLSWDPAYCPENNTPLYHVELSCSGSNTEWVDFGVGSATVTKFESSEKFPISFFREYRLRIFVHCTSFNPWHDVVIRTGPGELRPPRGVKVIGGNQTATITWLEPSNRDNMEIVVCDRTSKTSKNCTGALRSYSQTRKYVVERLTHSTPYTAMVSVSKNFMGKIYRSQPVSVDFATLPGEPTLRHEISSKGPDVTISLSWDPAYCPEDNSPLYHVELSSSGSDTEWVDFKEIRSATVTKFESSEKFPISFFREYRLRIFVRCTSFNLWHDVEIRTGPGELRPPRGVTVIGGSQTATITWLEPSNRDNMEIVVCYRTSKNCTGALRSYSQTRKCVVERLTQGTSYTAMVSVSKNFMGKIYRSQPVSVDFATLPGELPGPPSGITVLHERGRKIIQWDAEVNQRLLIAAYKVNATDLQSRKYTVLFTKIRRFELSTLKSNTRFELKISACMDTAGTRCGEPALLEISTMDIGYPSRPRVELVSRSGGRIIIRWSEPEEPFGPIDGYEIAYGLKGDSFSPSDWVSVGRSDRTKTFERLQTMTTYIFHVVAFNLDSRNRKLYSLPGILEMEYKFEGLAPGIEHNAELSVNRHIRGSVYRSRSVFVEFTTKHRQVKNFQPVHNFTVNVLRKERKVDLELGYKKPAPPPGAKFKGVIVDIVDRTKSPVVAGIMSNETRITIRDLPYFALFTVKVRAVYRHADDIVESDEASQSVDTGAEILLERPKILEAISINNRSALIRWSHIAHPGVELSHKIVLNNEISIDILRSDIESILIKDRLEPRRTYNVTIIAFFTYNGEMRSITSEGKQFKMLPEDALIAKPTVEDVKRKSVHLKWEVTLPDGSPKCEITVKYCSVSNGCSTTLISDMTTSSTILKTTPFLNYEITLNTTCSFANDITVFGVSETVHVFTAALPGPPLGVSIATVGGRRIIRWTAETDERFDVQCYKINATALHGTERAVLLRTNPSFDLSALRPNIRYKVEISSCIDTAANTCGAPAVVETTTIAPTVVGYPSRPEVKLVSQSRGQLVFRWTEPTEPHGPIDGYEYAYGRKGDSFSPSNWISTGSDIRSAVVTRLQADTTYIIHVVAFNINFRGRRLYSLSGTIEVSTESS